MFKKIVLPHIGQCLGCCGVSSHDFSLNTMGRHPNLVCPELSSIQDITLALRKQISVIVSLLPSHFKHGFDITPPFPSGIVNWYQLAKPLSYPSDNKLWNHFIFSVFP